MGLEIERKFLVKDGSWNAVASVGALCRQGYLFSAKEKTVRVRVMGSQAFLTIKGKTTGITRSEFEYEIPVQDAEAMLELCGSAVIEKTRYFIEHGGLTWELDVFAGTNDGLVLAEIELEAENQPFVLPPWAGKEVSSESRYYNAALANHPFSEWDES